MPVLENLAEGFANAAGATGAAQDIEKQKVHRQALSDEALEDTIQSHVDVMKGLQTKIGANPNDPQLQQQLSGERDQLYQLLHSTEQTKPGLVQKLFRHVFRKGDQPQQQPVNNLPSVGTMAAAAPTPQTDDLSRLPAGEQLSAIRKKYGLEPRAGTEKPDPENWTVVTGVTADGKPFTFQHNSKSGESQTLAGEPIGKEQLQGFTVPPKGAAPKVGSLGEFLTAAYGSNPTPQQQLQGRSLWAQANAGTTVGEHVILVPQPNNSIKAITVTTTSHKEFPGAPGASKPSPASQPQKPTVATPRPHAGIVSEGKTVGGKHTTAQNKADNDVVEATKLASIADQVATKPNDAINQKRLAVALERASAGRFTTQALDYIIKAGWGNTIEQWALSPSTGALPPDIMRQLIDGAHENLNGAKAAQKEAYAGAASTSSDSPKKDNDPLGIR